MVRPMEAWTGRMLELVREAPRERDWLIVEGSTLVPPGRAYREREKHRRNVRKSRGLMPRKDGEPSDKSIHIGSRRLVYTAYRYLVRSGQIIEYPHAGKTWVRIGTRTLNSVEVGLLTTRKRWADMSPEQREQINAKRIAGQRRWRDSLTPEARAEIGRRISEGKRRKAARSTGRDTEHSHHDG